MSTLQLNQFSSYKFDSEEEEAMAAQFSSANLQFIQNLLSAAAHQRISHEIIPNDLRSIQREAELKGELNILNHLLNSHQAAVEFFKRKSLENSSAL